MNKIYFLLFSMFFYQICWAGEEFSDIREQRRQQALVVVASSSTNPFSTAHLDGDVSRPVEMPNLRGLNGASSVSRRDRIKDQCCGACICSCCVLTIIAGIIVVAVECSGKKCI